MSECARCGADLWEEERELCRECKAAYEAEEREERLRDKLEKSRGLDNRSGFGARGLRLGGGGL